MIDFPRKIISGGQTGADQGGLRAAIKLGLDTGGTAPLGWETQDGPARWLEEYGLIEAFSGGYPYRTGENVKNSDATVRFALDFNSPGERCTLRMIKKFKKPHFDINPFTTVEFDTFKQWLIDNQVRVLNVAGNSERTAPGIFNATVWFLMNTLSRR